MSLSLTFLKCYVLIIHNISTYKYNMQMFVYACVILSEVILLYKKEKMCISVFSILWQCFSERNRNRHCQYLYIVQRLGCFRIWDCVYSTLDVFDDAMVCWYDCVFFHIVFALYFDISFPILNCLYFSDRISFLIGNVILFL